MASPYSIEPSTTNSTYVLTHFILSAHKLKILESILTTVLAFYNNCSTTLYTRVILYVFTTIRKNCSFLKLLISHLLIFAVSKNRHISITSKIVLQMFRKKKKSNDNHTIIHHFMKLCANAYTTQQPDDKHQRN